MATTPNTRIHLNLGGTHFSTTTTNPNPTFTDWDPHHFTSLLSLHPTHHPHSTPSSFTPFDSTHTHTLSPPSDPLINSISTVHFNILLLSHSGLLSSYNTSTLSRSATIRTHLDHISTLHPLSPSLAALGSGSEPGLHFYNTHNGKPTAEVLWWDPSDPRTHKASVTAIHSDFDKDAVFASFECWHGENAILVVDKSTAKIVSEFGRQRGTAAKSAAVRKLKWVPQVGVLVGSSVVCGAFGYSGLVRVWDPRVGGGNVVWETSEPGGLIRTSRISDPMADVDVDVDGLFIAKVGSRTGDLGVVDVRKLGGSDDPWVYLEDPNPGLNGFGVGGKGVVVHCYKKHVFVGKEDGLECWSRVEDRKLLSGDNDVAREGGNERDWGVYRRNYVDKVEDVKRGLIWKIQGGENRLFVCRENVEGVEVWETSDFSAPKSIL